MYRAKMSVQKYYSMFACTEIEFALRLHSTLIYGDTTQ